MMRMPRIGMGGNIIIEEAPDFLDTNALLEKLPKQGCGAIVSFLGITRGQDGDANDAYASHRYGRQYYHRRSARFS